MAGGAWRAVRSWQSRPALRIWSDPADTDSVTVRYLMYVLLPGWLLPGIADYLMHRRTRLPCRMARNFCAALAGAHGPSPLRARNARRPRSGRPLRCG